MSTVIGHRGAAGLAPENTIASFRTAARLGVRSIELDVKLAGDGTPVVIHDDTLDRTTNASGAVADTSADELALVDAGSWFDPAFAGECVPTFEAVLDLCDELDLEAMCEIKPSRGREAETGRAAARAVAARGRHQVSSFSRVAIAAARDAAPQVPRSLLFVMLADHWEDVVAELDCSAVGVWAGVLTKATIDAVKRSGRALGSYTVNDRERARFLLAHGVDAVFSDYPDRVRG